MLIEESSLAQLSSVLHTSRYYSAPFLPKATVAVARPLRRVNPLHSHCKLFDWPFQPPPSLKRTTAIINPLKYGIARRLLGSYRQGTELARDLPIPTFPEIDTLLSRLKK